MMAAIVHVVVGATPVAACKQVVLHFCGRQLAYCLCWNGTVGTDWGTNWRDWFRSQWAWWDWLGNHWTKTTRIGWGATVEWVELMCWTHSFVCWRTTGMWNWTEQMDWIGWHQCDQPLLSCTGVVVPFVLSCNHDELTMMLSWVCGVSKTAKR